MQATSLGDILSAISDRADLPTLSATTFITKAQMTRWINQSGRRLMGKLVEAYGEGHWQATQDITTTADQDYTATAASATPVSTDIYRVIGLRVTLEGTRLRLRRASMHTMDAEDDTDTGGWTASRPPRWRFIEGLDQRFSWTRTPKAAHTVRVHYVPYFVFLDFSSEPAAVAVMSDDTNHKVRSHMGWDEWIILDCAIKAIKRQDLPVEVWQGLALEQKELEADILAGAKRRTDEPLRIQDKFNTQKSDARWAID